MTCLEQWTTDARRLGIEHSEAAATWAADGTTVEQAKATLELLREGDPAVWDWMPREPDLSGEYADDLTPALLFAQVTGVRPGDGLAELVEQVADAYLDGVSVRFSAACERVLVDFIWQEVTR
jgi:hypothetical protein